MKKLLKLNPEYLIGIGGVFFDVTSKEKKAIKSL